VLKNPGLRHQLLCSGSLRRAQTDMTQAKLGAKVGLCFQAVQKYETGENRISASRLYQLARILDVPPSYFFEGLGEPGRPTKAPVRRT
jgi:transcriptional regulator with XRE-family HTH domain